MTNRECIRILSGRVVVVTIAWTRDRLDNFDWSRRWLLSRRSWDRLNKMKNFVRFELKKEEKIVKVLLISLERSVYRDESQVGEVCGFEGVVMVLKVDGWVLLVMIWPGWVGRETPAASELKLGAAADENEEEGGRKSLC